MKLPLFTLGDRVRHTEKDAAGVVAGMSMEHSPDGRLWVYDVEFDVPFVKGRDQLVYMIRERDLSKVEGA